MLQSVLKFIKDKVLVVAFVILGGLCLYQFIFPREVIKTVESVKLVPTTIYKDKEGKENSRVQETVVSKNEMKALTKTDKKKLHATSINSETQIVDHNSITMTNDTVSIKRYDTRKWLLGATTHQVNITHTDTAIHSVAASSLTFKEPRVLFVIGPYVGYDVLHQKPAVGISITMNIFAIKSKR